MRRLNIQDRTRVINCLLEGCSIRATVRLTGIAKKTVLRLLVDAGLACEQFQNEAMRNLNCRRLQLNSGAGHTASKRT